jgi:regulator of sirC expression with transglutaminase-like and TPR domain
VTTRAAAEAHLRSLGGADDGAIDIAEAALALAVLDRPAVPLDRYRHHLGRLAAAATHAFTAIGDLRGARRRHAALTRALVGGFDYRGDRQAYDDLQNANLMRVIDRRRGLPIALGILYLHAGRAQGWAVDGLNFPGHFLLRIETDGERLIFDPFDDGAPVDPAGMRALLKASSGADAELAPEHYAPAANRDVLIRLQNNIKIRLLRGGQTGAALKVVESMLIFAPDRPNLWYEAGMLRSHLGNLRGALLALGQCLDTADNARLRNEVTRLMQSISSRLN